MRQVLYPLLAACIVSSVDAQFCCMAFTPQCNACNAGVTVEVYCANNPTFPGCDAYITKPVDTRSLAQDIVRIVGEYRAHAASPRPR